MIKNMMADLSFEKWTQIVSGKLPLEYRTVGFQMVTVVWLWIE
jgi:hypothetical protein